jgi:hypothetical protein
MVIGLAPIRLIGNGAFGAARSGFSAVFRHQSLMAASKRPCRWNLSALPGNRPTIPALRSNEFYSFPLNDFNSVPFDELSLVIHI